MVTLGKNMRSVSIVGVGCTPFKDFEEHPETQGIGEGEAFGYAALEAIADAGLEPRDIDFFYHGSANPYLVGDCITPNMQVPIGLAFAPRVPSIIPRLAARATSPLSRP